jgi:hypothetical protein
VFEVESLDGNLGAPRAQVWIGGFGFRAVSDQGVWWRLMRSEFSSDPNIFRVFIESRWSERKRREALAIIPPSEKVSTLLVSDDVNWRAIVMPDKPERGFAAMIADKEIKRLVVGPPTEEVWEDFINLWRAVRT